LFFQVNALMPSTLQLTSTVLPSGQLEIALVHQTLPPLGDHDVRVEVQATPINPSDIGLLFGAADLSTLRAISDRPLPTITADIPDQAMAGMAGRLGQSLPVGNEGAGRVVQAGAAPEAQALLGRTVAMVGGGMYAQQRVLPASQCLALPDGTPAADGASCFINPLTALGMVETMRREGHKALIHTAAASNLGQMLNRICQQDGIELVNIVRQPTQAKILRDLGARHVCDSSSPSFETELTEALAQTGATLAFDATGGGTLASQILSCMESAIQREAKEYSRYGSNTHKQVYLYGNLNLAPTEIRRSFGMAWGVGGWLLFPSLNRFGAERTQALKQRVMNELHTTFASHYSQTISLPDVLKTQTIAAYTQRTTSGKFLIKPNQ
jgi:NADPH:quinone reductase-like Zn-dependent oxidoreductase